MSQTLIDLFNRDLLPEDHQLYLQHLDIEPKIIYDIGACVLHWTRHARNRWPNSKIYLFEAMPDVKFLYEGKFEYSLNVLSDINGKVVNFHQNTEHPGGNSYYKENNIFSNLADILFDDEHTFRRMTRTLDSVVEESNFHLPDLIKIDVQGAELDILKGAPKVLTHTKDILIEIQNVEYNIGAPGYNKVVPFLIENGFELVTKFSSSHPDAPDSDYHFRRKPT